MINKEQTEKISKELFGSDTFVEYHDDRINGYWIRRGESELIGAGDSWVSALENAKTEIKHGQPLRRVTRPIEYAQQLKRCIDKYNIYILKN